MATLDIEGVWEGGRLCVTVANGTAKHIDKLDPTSARSRSVFLNRVREKLPQLNEEQIEQFDKYLVHQAIERPAPRIAAAEEDDPSQASDDALSKMPAEIVTEAREMLRVPELLSVVAKDIAQLGVVGESNQALTVFLLAISRLLAKPFSAITQGTSSSGKSFVADRVGQLIPPECKVMATSLTPNALYYMPPGSLRHRVVFAGERSRIEDDERAEATRGLREMLASGWLRKAIPVKDGNGNFETKLIEQRGPIAYIESTTLGTIFDEDRNRMLLLASDDSPEQTRRVLDAIGQRYADPASRDDERTITRHHAAQRLLRRVVVRIPFAGALAAAMPANLPESRRAIEQALAVVQAIALLHQFQRHDNPQHGATIAATVDDYRVARELLVEPLGRSLGGALPGGITGFLVWLRTAATPTESWKVSDLLHRDGCRWQQTTVYDYVKVLRTHGHLDDAGQDGRANLYRLSACADASGAAWLPQAADIEARL